MKNKGKIRLELEIFRFSADSADNGLSQRKTVNDYCTFKCTVTQYTLLRGF